MSSTEEARDLAHKAHINTHNTWQKWLDKATVSGSKPLGEWLGFYNLLYLRKFHPKISSQNLSKEVHMQQLRAIIILNWGWLNIHVAKSSHNTPFLIHIAVEHTTTYYFRDIPLDVRMTFLKAYIKHVSTCVTRSLNDARLLYVKGECSPRCAQGKGDLMESTKNTSSHEAV